MPLLVSIQTELNLIKNLRLKIIIETSTKIFFFRELTCLPFFHATRMRTVSNNCIHLPSAYHRWYLPASAPLGALTPHLSTWIPLSTWLSPAQALLLAFWLCSVLLSSLLRFNGDGGTTAIGTSFSASGAGLRIGEAEGDTAVRSGGTLGCSVASFFLLSSPQPFTRVLCSSRNCRYRSLSPVGCDRSLSSMLCWQ